MESLIFQEHGLTWVKFEGCKHLLCQLYLPEIYQSLKLYFYNSQRLQIASFYATAIATFLTIEWRQKQPKNACFGKGYISIPLCSLPQNKHKNINKTLVLLYSSSLLYIDSIKQCISNIWTVKEKGCLRKKMKSKFGELSFENWSQDKV